MKKIYAALAVPGFLLPFWQFIVFVRGYGFDPGAFFSQPFVNAVSSMLTFDLLISCAVFWTFIFAERRVRRPWLYVALTLMIGLSFALPMFLLARENRADAREFATAAA
jgi:hypothetical protein